MVKLSKLYEKTRNQLHYFDKYKIDRIRIDKIETEHIIDILVKDRFVTDDIRSSKIIITKQGNKRLKNKKM